MVIDPFRLCVAIGPLAIYCLVLGVINLSQRPRVTTGARDLLALAAAVTGLVIVGPMELFLPEAAASHFGGWVWLLMLAFYGLAVLFLVLLTRPRLVVYNLSVEELRPILERTLSQLDPAGQWAGDSLVLPHLDVQLHLESFPSMRNIALVANGDEQSLAGWRRLERALATALREASVQRNPRGLSLLTAGILMLASCIFQSLSNQPALAQGMRDLLRL